MTQRPRALTTGHDLGGRRVWAPPPASHLWTWRWSGRTVQGPLGARQGQVRVLFLPCRASLLNLVESGLRFLRDPVVAGSNCLTTFTLNSTLLAFGRFWNRYSTPLSLERSAVTSPETHRRQNKLCYDPIVLGKRLFLHVEVHLDELECILGPGAANSPPESETTRSPRSMR
jgi:hypothetical protein